MDKQLFLAMDTSTQALSVALGSVQGSAPLTILGERTEVVAKGHSFRLMPMIDQLMDQQGVSPAELHGIVVGRGPGSYTGVRVGVTVGKSMAWSLQIPIIGVSSLDGLTGVKGDQLSASWVCALIDARRDRAYGALYHKESGVLHKIVPDQLAAISDWVQQISEIIGQGHESQTVAFTGDGAVFYQDKLRDALGERAIFAESEVRIQATSLLYSGVPLLLAGTSDDVDSFAPQYLQMAEAEAKLREQRRGDRG